MSSSDTNPERNGKSPPNKTPDDDPSSQNSYLTSIHQKLSKDATDYWNYSSKKLSTAADEASKQCTSFIDSVASYSPFPTTTTTTPLSSPPPPPPITMQESHDDLSTNTNQRRNINPQMKWLVQNPYSSVRGFDNTHGSSLNAVRSLLSVVPLATTTSKNDSNLDEHQQQHHHPVPPPLFPTPPISSIDDDEDNDHNSMRRSISAESAISIGLYHPPHQAGVVSDAETASRLAEGTIRALRDLVLDEAVELNEALRFWMERWERPSLTWVEAGPLVWFSKDGYDHQLVGQKVSQIQAVLARRCASIGELQQHLLRAGWQKGVAQWGVLGQGGQWATVVGGDGIMDEQSSHRIIPDLDDEEDEREEEPMEILPKSSKIGTTTTITTRPKLIFHPKQQQQQRRSSRRRSKAFDYNALGHVMVHNTPGGEISTNDSALAAWSVDAIRVVRDQIYRAGEGIAELPYYENWSQEERHFRQKHESGGGQVILKGCDDGMLPVWATLDVVPNDDTAVDATTTTTIEETEETDSAATAKQNNEVITITDLSLMTAEVTELLNAMEVQMKIQRNRRLAKLKPIPRIMRRWFIYAAVVPSAGYIAYKIIKNRSAIQIARHILFKIATFYEEHVAEPLRYIVSELFTGIGRKDITDQIARTNAMESLKKMLSSWLDETYPTMPPSLKTTYIQSMDISLIEQKKEENIKHSLYNIQDIVRMSLIEMQFIKKELMNAMSAIDELMESNEINFRIAAMTPSIMIIWGAKWTFEFLFYVILKLGQSREETYASLRDIVLDIERLLVMRDDPPSAPLPLANGGVVEFGGRRHRVVEDGGNDDTGLILARHPSSTTMQQQQQQQQQNVLNSDDLGMLILLIHECRTILWKDRRRFSRATLKSFSEDLAELAGERGAVSVKQQLHIVARMSRTYPFLKVVSTGVPLDVSRFI